MAVTEIAPRTWRVASRFGERDLFQYVVVGDQHALIIDAGTANTPRDTILPALRTVGLNVTYISYVVVTHPDLDHQGGLAGLKERLPAARVVCGFEDRPLVRDPEALLRDRYGPYADDHGMGYPPAAVDEMRALAGGPTKIDLGLTGGERLDLGGRTLHVHHAPGHSAGHLVLHEPDTGLLFSSDAVHGSMCPDSHGRPALPPTYEQVDDYLATITLLAGLRPDALHSGHWPTLTGNEITGFLEESRAFVERTDALLLECFERPCTLHAACVVVDARMGPFGTDPINLMFAVHGHVRRALRSGRIAVVDVDERPLRFARRS